MASITANEAEQIDKANASGRAPVVFVHGLWLLPSGWDRWRTANLNPWTEAKVNSKNPDRGPLLIINGETDHTVPRKEQP